MSEGGGKRSDAAKAWAVLALALACCVAAVILIEVRFKARKLQARLDEVERLKTDLREQNSRYMIELTSFSDYSELYRRATDEHGMAFPAYEEGSLVNLGAVAALPRPEGERR